MENFETTLNGAEILIEGFPDAIKVLKLSGSKAQRLSDLSLHKSDLDFAADCLEAINHTPAEPHTLRSALWRCAIIHYVKCFGHSESRFSLIANQIYRNEPPEALIAHKYFRDLRNKQFVHDENSFTQCIPGAALNKGDKPYKIEKILCLGMRVEVLEQATYGSLKLLIEKSHDWVVAEFDQLCDELAQELEGEAYEALLARECIKYDIPTNADVRRTRTKHL